MNRDVRETNQYLKDAWVCVYSSVNIRHAQGKQEIKFCRVPSTNKFSKRFTPIQRVTWTQKVWNVRTDDFAGDQISASSKHTSVRECYNSHLVLSLIAAKEKKLRCSQSCIYSHYIF